MTASLFVGLEVDPAMARLGRWLAERNGWTFLGVVQGRGLVASVPMAQLRDGHGQLQERTLEDLRAELKASARAAGERKGPSDTRTLSLF